VFYSSILLLAHKISRLGLSTHKEKVCAILDLKPPLKVSELQTFLGMIVYFSAFIPYYASIARLLFHLLWKDSWWCISKTGGCLMTDRLDRVPLSRPVASVNQSNCHLHDQSFQSTRRSDNRMPVYISLMYVLLAMIANPSVHWNCRNTYRTHCSSHTRPCCKLPSRGPPTKDSGRMASGRPKMCAAIASRRAGPPGARRLA
jgi:hypothetical protein